MILGMGPEVKFGNGRDRLAGRDKVEVTEELSLASVGAD
jgi:hypothetical protein